MAQPTDQLLIAVIDTNDGPADPTLSAEPGDAQYMDYADVSTVLENIKAYSNLERYTVDENGAVEPFEYPNQNSIEDLLDQFHALATGFGMLEMINYTCDGTISFLAQEQERELVARFVDVYRGVYDEVANFENTFAEGGKYLDDVLRRMEVRVDVLLEGLDTRLVLGE
jgi:hypothetical protein